MIINLDMNINDEISRSISHLLLKEPFFGHLLASLVRCVDDEMTPTAAVGLHGIKPMLVINGPYFLKVLKSSQERTGIIKHEVLHVLFKHLFRSKFGTLDPVIFNLAADLVANQFIGEPWKLPKDCITLDKFPDLNLKPDQSVEYYYGALKGCKEGPSKDLIDAFKGNHSDHGMWVDKPGKPGDADIAQCEIDRIVLQAKERAGSKGWGPLPNAIKDLINAALERRKPKIDWKRTMRLFSSSARRTKIKGTISRRSKRYGTIPGIKVKRLQHLCVILDTSGSVSDSNLSEFFAEVHSMWKAGAEITVVECDAAVQRTWTYAGKLPKGVAGRGGTVFDPALTWLKEYRGASPIDGAIYLTDGQAGPATVKPPCKLLWVVVPNGTIGDHLKFGRVIQMTK